MDKAAQQAQTPNKNSKVSLKKPRSWEVRGRVGKGRKWRKGNVGEAH